MKKLIHDFTQKAKQIKTEAEATLLIKDYMDKVLFQGFIDPVSFVKSQDEIQKILLAQICHEKVYKLFSCAQNSVSVGCYQVFLNLIKAGLTSGLPGVNNQTVAADIKKLLLDKGDE